MQAAPSHGSAEIRILFGHLVFGPDALADIGGFERFAGRLGGVDSDTQAELGLLLRDKRAVNHHARGAVIASGRGNDDEVGALVGQREFGGPQEGKIVGPLRRRLGVAPKGHLERRRGKLRLTVTVAARRWGVFSDAAGQQEGAQEANGRVSHAPD